MGNRTKPEAIHDEWNKNRLYFLLLIPVGITVIILGCVWIPTLPAFANVLKIICIVLGVIIILIGLFVFWQSYNDEKKDVDRYREEQRIKFEKEDADRERRDARVY